MALPGEAAGMNDKAEVKDKVSTASDCESGSLCIQLSAADHREQMSAARQRGEAQSLPSGTDHEQYAQLDFHIKINNPFSRGARKEIKSGAHQVVNGLKHLLPVKIDLHKPEKHETPGEKAKHVIDYLAHDKPHRHQPGDNPLGELVGLAVDGSIDIYNKAKHYMPKEEQQAEHTEKKRRGHK